MYIQKLILKNFQKHSDLKLDFTTGVNVIYGATDSGKSCIRRAISWVFFNTPQGDVIRKEGTKKTSVKAILNNNISVERIKSASINAYILTVGDEEKRFDSVGRKIPEEVQKALRTSLIDVNGETINLNIADQIALPFLLDKSGTFRSKLFNKLTGSEITDKVLQDLNKDILKISREDKIIEEDLTQNQQKHAKILKTKGNLEYKYNKGIDKYNTLEKQENLHSKLNELSDKLLSNEKVQCILIDKLSKFKKEIPSIIDLKQKEQLICKLKNVDINIKKNKNNFNLIKSNITNIKEVPTSLLGKLKDIWRKLDMFKNLSNKISVKKNRIKEIENNRKKANLKQEKWIKRYKEELKKREICPTCYRKLNEETIENIKL